MNSKLILAGLCFMVQPLFSDMVRESMATNETACYMTYKPTGRDDEGRQTFEYGRECYEQ